MTLLRCAHISDLHFAKPTWSPLQFFSKRWVGNLNLIFSRQKTYAPDNLGALVATFKDLKVTHTFITGDLSCTSSDAELSLAKHFISEIKALGIQVFVVPGNHDHYTKQAYQNQVFYDYFDPHFSDTSSINLKKDKVSLARLAPHWWLVGLDTTLATPLFSASGDFSQEIENCLTELLATIPSEDQIILMNHFPIFELESLRNKLVRKEALRSLLRKHPQIRFYLHGHTHRHCVADLRPNQLPIVLDSGSTAHKTIGSWNLIDIKEEHCCVQPYHWQGEWKPTAEHLFTW